MVLKSRFYFTILIFMNLSTFFSQEEEVTFYKEIKPKHTYNLDFALPVSLSNKVFKGIMQGFIRFSGSYQYSLKNNFYMGLGGNYTYFQVNRFKISPQIRGGMHLANGYLKLGCEKYYSERIGLDVGIKAGGSQVIFHSDSLIKQTKTYANLIEPYFSFCLTGSHNTAYKWTLGYTFLGLGFYPQRIGDDENVDYPTSEYKRITQFLSFGFSFSHYFKQQD